MKKVTKKQMRQLRAIADYGNAEYVRGFFNGKHQSAKKARQASADADTAFDRATYLCGLPPIEALLSANAEDF